MAWNGKQGRGAKRVRQEIKRQEAEERNALTPLERTRAFRQKRRTY